MSAYVVSTDTIDYLVTAARVWRLSEGYLPQEARYMIDRELGQVLLTENVRSVNARYNDNDEAEAYDYTPVRFDAIRAVDVLKSVQCLRYQSCETDDFDTTLAARVLNALESAAIAHLPGYDKAPWGWQRPAVAAEQAGR